MALDWNELCKPKDPLEVSEKDISRYRDFSRECEDTLEAIRAAMLLYRKGLLSHRQFNKMERALKKATGYYWWDP